MQERPRPPRPRPGKIHQAELKGRGRDRNHSDPAAEAAFLDGESSLRDAIGIDDETLAMLRRQAHALFEAGKHERARDVLLGIAALGQVHPADLVLLSASYLALGEAEIALTIQSSAEALIDALDEGRAQ